MEVAAETSAHPPRGEGTGLYKGDYVLFYFYLRWN